MKTLLLFHSLCCRWQELLRHCCQIYEILVFVADKKSVFVLKFCKLNSYDNLTQFPQSDLLPVVDTCKTISTNHNDHYTPTSLPHGILHATHV